jgi:hypothetical protein
VPRKIQQVLVARRAYSAWSESLSSVALPAVATYKGVGVPKKIEFGVGEKRKNWELKALL